MDMGVGGGRYNAGRTGGTMTGVYSAANEQAVAMFLDKKIGYFDMFKVKTKGPVHAYTRASGQRTPPRPAPSRVRAKAKARVRVRVRVRVRALGGRTGLAGMCPHAQPGRPHPWGAIS